MAGRPGTQSKLIMKLIWLPEAKSDIQRLHKFLVKKEQRAAERAVRIIQTGAKKLLEYPQIGSRMDEDTGRRELFLPFGVGAYVLRYVIHNEHIVVIRIWHSREHRGD